MSAGDPFKMNGWNVLFFICNRDGILGIQISAALTLPSFNPFPPSEKVISIKNKIIEVFVSILPRCWRWKIKLKLKFYCFPRISHGAANA